MDRPKTAPERRASAGATSQIGSHVTSSQDQLLRGAGAEDVPGETNADHSAIPILPR